MLKDICLNEFTPEQLKEIDICKNNYTTRRNPERITIIISQLRALWEMYPIATWQDLIEIISDIYVESPYKSIDSFYLEEDDWYILFETHLRIGTKIMELDKNKDEILLLIEEIWLQFLEDYRFMQILNILPNAINKTDEELIHLLKNLIKDLKERRGF